MKTRHPGLRMACGIALAGTGTLLGEQAAAVDARTGQLEEIVVTATRHEESLSKVPVSVTAMNQEMLDNKGIKDIQDVVRFTPGITIDTSGTNAISIRGVSSSGGAGTTGIYIDDTPIQIRALGFNPDDALPKAFDLDRVEVLRGPQGTLFGAGSEGGTVRYIMAQPSLTKDSTYARTELSTTHGGEPSAELGIAHGGPIINGVLGYRASAWYRYDGGYIDRINPDTLAIVDQNANHANTFAGRLSFIWQPTDGLTFTPAVMYQNSRKHDQSTFWPAYSSKNNLVNASPERNPVPDEYYLPSLKIEADIGKVKFVSNTSYFHRNEQTAYLGTVYDLAYYQSLGWLDVSGNGSGAACGTASSAPTPPCSWYPLIDANGIHPIRNPTTGALLFPGFSTPNTITNQQRSITQEFRLQSNDPVSKLTWTVGAFWSLTKETSIELLTDQQFPAVYGALYGASLDPSAYFGGGYSCKGQTLGTVDPSFPAIPDCAIYYNNNQSHDRQLAGFSEATYAFTDQWKLTLGGRYARMSFDLSHYGNGLENFGPGTRSGSITETAFTPKVGLAFQADSQNLYYATYAKGFRPGGVNAPLPPNFCGQALIAEGYANGQSPETFKSDATQSYELGSKNSFNNRVKISSSAYYIKWHGIQQNVYVPGSCGLQFTDNLGEAEIKGFDFQAEAVLGGGFSVDASLGYTSARYSADSPKANLASKGDAISGEAAINYSPGTNPPWNAAVGAQYNFTLNDHDTFVRLDWEIATRNPWLAAVQDPNSSQYNANAYTLPSTNFASLRAGLTLGAWQVSAFIDNLFDSRTITNYALVQVDANNPNFNRLQPSSVQQNQFTFRPRTIGITASYRL